MRLTLPTHISVPGTVAFAGTLVCVQQLQHTSLAFSLMFFTFTVVSTLCFNLAGGMSRPSGGYIFFFALLTVIIGVTLKAILNEPADSNLETPLLTMAVYTCGILVMLPTVLLAKKLTGRPKGLASLIGGNRINLRYSGIGCMIVGIFIFIINMFVVNQSGSLLSALNQTNFFLPVGIILITVDTLQRSDGNRSICFPSLAGMLFVLFVGMLNFSKQSVLTPFAAWAVGAFYGRLRLRLVHWIVVPSMMLVLSMILGPVTSIGRNLPETNVAGRLQQNWELLSNFGQTRARFNEDLAFSEATATRHGYYTHSLGIGDRLSILNMDDALISYTEKGNEEGLAPIEQYFENWIPHFLLPNKIESGTFYSGNLYAHELGGILAPEDFSTGISFGFLGESYHLVRWVGIFLIAPAIWLLLFVVTDLVCGETQYSVWPLLPIMLFAHTAPESLVGGLVYFIWFGNIGIVLAIVFSTYVTPVLGNLFGRGGRGQAATMRPLRRSVAATT